jgi:hypothetical protein
MNKYSHKGGTIMKINYGFNAKVNQIVKMAKRTLLLTAYAEENDPPNTDPNNPTPPATDPPKANPINFEDLIAKARKEEKDKLYPKITALEKERDGLVEKINAHLLTIGQKDTRISELENQIKNSGASESEVVKGLRAEIETLKTQLATAGKNTVDPVEIENRIKSEYEVKLYRMEKLKELAETKEGYIPELVTGMTREEIDASLKVAKQRYADILKSAGVSNNNIPPVNVNTSKINVKNMKMEDLVNLDPKSAEYKEIRKQLGLK